MSDKLTGNREIASKFNQVADLLELEEANPFRVLSYRNAATTISNSNRSVAERFREGGIEALEQLEGIGQKLAGSIKEIVQTGRLGLLDRLKTDFAPEKLLAEVPGIGRELASRIHSQLGISSLEELELAAHDGRLYQIDGLGKKRVQGVRSTLAGMLSQSSIRRARQRANSKRDSGKHKEPSVKALLAIDAEYRRKAEAGELPTIAPKRFNPDGKKWLPVLETKRDGLSFTALFSNTARAHELDKTHDWVIIYYENGEEDQYTVVTATRGRLNGKRVVRGRERECYQYYT
jgi:Holliday junction resolvasome RuvABC DNA-binding subunit